MHAFLTKRVQLIAYISKLGFQCYLFWCIQTFTLTFTTPIHPSYAHIFSYLATLYLVQKSRLGYSSIKIYLSALILSCYNTLLFICVFGHIYWPSSSCNNTIQSIIKSFKYSYKSSLYTFMEYLLLKFSK